MFLWKILNYFLTFHFFRKVKFLSDLNIFNNCRANFVNLLKHKIMSRCQDKILLSFLCWNTFCVTYIILNMNVIIKISFDITHLWGLLKTNIGWLVIKSSSRVPDNLSFKTPLYGLNNKNPIFKQISSFRTLTQLLIKNK